MNDLFYFNVPVLQEVSTLPARVKQPSVYLTHKNRLPKFAGSCVYLHRRRTDNTVFYVGMGSRHRSMATGGRNHLWSEVYRAHGRLVQIVDVFDTHEAARHAEMEVIDLLRQMGVELTNCSDGGEGGLHREDIDIAEACKTAINIMQTLGRARLCREEGLPPPPLKPAAAKPKKVQRLPPPSSHYSQADLLAGLQRLAEMRERRFEERKQARKQAQSRARQRKAHPLETAAD